MLSCWVVRMIIRVSLSRIKSYTFGSESANLVNFLGRPQIELGESDTFIWKVAANPYAMGVGMFLMAPTKVN